MKILSIYLGHDANVTFLDTVNDNVLILELERVFEDRYYKFPSTQERCNLIVAKILLLLEEVGVQNNFDLLILSNDGPQHLDFSKIKAKDVERCDHHLAHAVGAYSLSPYKDVNVLSYDGSGNDGCFNYYNINENDFTLIDSMDTNVGWAYEVLSNYVREVSEAPTNRLALAGKAMGYAAYGEPIANLKPRVKDFMRTYFTKHDQNSIGEALYLMGVRDLTPSDGGVLCSLLAANFAATFQEASEEIVIDFLKKHGFPDNLCITGGCALNILINQKIIDMGCKLFVPPNPSDCGLSFGQAICGNWKFTGKMIKSKPITYSGLPIQDSQKIDLYKEQRRATKVNLSDMARRLKKGEIIGVCRGNSEVGPRALGNRSILCDPVFPEMKKIINSKIKNREWYRPFAGVCRLEDAPKFFEINSNQECEFMVFCPNVREEYREDLKSITHVDGTCRLQTVTKEQNSFIYNLLSQKELGDVPVLLNTSFNINGKPMLSKAEVALEILDTTKLDAVLIEDWFFEK